MNRKRAKWNRADDESRDMVDRVEQREPVANVFQGFLNVSVKRIASTSWEEISVMGVAVVVVVERTFCVPLNDDGSTYIVRRILEWISTSR